jgi:Tfp pilus assembly protein PilO
MNNRVLPILVLVLALGVFIGYVNPTWTGEVAEINDAIAANEDALAAAKSYLAREEVLLQKRDAMDQNDLAKLSAMLPNGIDNVGLILALNALAARSGLALSNVDVSQPTGANAANGTQGFSSGAGPDFDRATPTGSVDLTLTATGSYAAFQSFLSGVERSQRLLDVRSISVQGTNTGLYTYQMTIRFYWLR